MSTTELLPLFPSATHPAIPVAAAILSTLRSLTAPGKGNDLRSEERAALVGVAALLGCEKVHSKDLIQSSAQKASSVSPAHFRSALARSRTILASLPSDTFTKSPARRTSSRSGSGRSSPSTPASASASASASGAAPATASSSVSTAAAVPVGEEDTTDAGEGSIARAGGVSPFSTPKKKFKYSSGVDISSLVKHSPAKGSPLRQSVTPSGRPEKRQTPTQRGAVSDRHAAVVGEVGMPPTEGDEEEEEEEEEENDEEGPESARTPTKRRTYSSGVDRGGDLQAGPSAASTSASASTRSARRPGDTSAFFALRPGSGDTGSGIAPQDHRGRDRDRSVSPTPEKRGVLAPRRNLQEVRERRVLGKRRDWRYPEVVWAERSVRQENEKYLDQLWSDLPAFLAKHALPSIEQTVPTGSTVRDLLLSSTSTSTSQATSTAT
ncbi:hypothetical protein JCM24511_02806 [Saitozyma sp. JCM 24511]|nr:hypothetical protein JCM24511_02806 [Saitozyma sp. JCM 24511]